MNTENEQISLTGSDEGPTFQERVYALADDVLMVMKELHLEQKKQINSRNIAEKMLERHSVKQFFLNGNGAAVEKCRIDPLKNIVDNILYKFSEFIPSNDIDEYNRSEDHIPGTETAGSAEWMNLSMQRVRKYLDSMSTRVCDLEDLLEGIIEFIVTTESYSQRELSLMQGNIRDDTEFEDNISSDLIEIRKSFDTTDDLNGIKAIVSGKIANINKNIEKKREQDLLKLKETEQALKEMSSKMSAIKSEAEELKKSSQRAKRESLHDTLTELPNRRAYDQKIKEALAKLKGLNVSSTLMICDIDHFKRINDEYGHHTGDLALKKVAQLLKSKIREDDFIARYGGEEFTIILSHSSIGDAEKVAENLRSFFEKLSFTFKGNDISITISMGISAFRTADESEAVFDRADAALYLAKNSGRNNVKTENDL